jgi:hypothetical protein
MRPRAVRSTSPGTASNDESASCSGSSTSSRTASSKRSPVTTSMTRPTTPRPGLEYFAAEPGACTSAVPFRLATVACSVGAESSK